MTEDTQLSIIYDGETYPPYDVLSQNLLSKRAITYFEIAKRYPDLVNNKASFFAMIRHLKNHTHGANLIPASTHSQHTGNLGYILADKNEPEYTELEVIRSSCLRLVRKQIAKYYNENRHEEGWYDISPNIRCTFPDLGFFGEIAKTNFCVLQTWQSELGKYINRAVVFDSEEQRVIAEQIIVNGYVDNVICNYKLDDIVPRINNILMQQLPPDIFNQLRAEAISPVGYALEGKEIYRVQRIAQELKDKIFPDDNTFINNVKNNNVFYRRYNKFTSPKDQTKCDYDALYVFLHSNVIKDLKLGFKMHKQSPHMIVVVKKTAGEEFTFEKNLNIFIPIELSENEFRQYMTMIGSTAEPSLKLAKSDETVHQINMRVRDKFRKVASLLNLEIVNDSAPKAAIQLPGIGFPKPKITELKSGFNDQFDASIQNFNLRDRIVEIESYIQSLLTNDQIDESARLRYQKVLGEIYQYNEKVMSVDLKRELDQISSKFESLMSDRREYYRNQNLAFPFQERNLIIQEAADRLSHLVLRCKRVYTRAEKRNPDSNMNKVYNSILVYIDKLPKQYGHNNRLATASD